MFVLQVIRKLNYLVTRVSLSVWTSAYLNIPCKRFSKLEKKQIIRFLLHRVKVIQFAMATQYLSQHVIQINYPIISNFHII